MALAAMLVIVLAGAVGYRMTQSPVRLLAAELTADHVMCFIFHGDPDRAPTRGEVEQALERQFGWNAALPSESQEAGLELVGVRPCLSADGRVAHIMYRYEGRPVSVYMVPDLARAAGLFDVLGHRAMAWTFEGRTYVLVASEPPAEMARIARLMYAGLR